MSEIWKRKVKKYFSSLDFNNDGIVSKKDFVELWIRFSMSEEADNQKTQQLTAQFENVRSLR